jgi:hypothetical protein
MMALLSRIETEVSLGLIGKDALKIFKDGTLRAGGHVRGADWQTKFHLFDKGADDPALLGLT